MKKDSTFTITNTTQAKISSVSFHAIKDVALGKNYELSLVFVGDKKSRELNKKHRGKDKPTNVLSFSLEKNVGEIFIAPGVVKKQTKEFGRSFENLVVFLFIHGLMHLKGFDHGSTMERAEQKLRKQFLV